MTGEEIIADRVEYLCGDIQGNSDFTEKFEKWYDVLLAEELLESTPEELAERFKKIYALQRQGYV